MCGGGGAGPRLFLRRAGPSCCERHSLAWVSDPRHAVDADYIAAIDNVVRKLMQERRLSIRVIFLPRRGMNLSRRRPYDKAPPANPAVLNAIESRSKFGLGDAGPEAPSWA